LRKRGGGRESLPWKRQVRGPVRRRRYGLARKKNSWKTTVVGGGGVTQINDIAETKQKQDTGGAIILSKKGGDARTARLMASQKNQPRKTRAKTQHHKAAIGNLLRASRNFKPVILHCHGSKIRLKKRKTRASKRGSSEIEKKTKRLAKDRRRNEKLAISKS